MASLDTGRVPVRQRARVGRAAAARQSERGPALPHRAPRAARAAGLGVQPPLPPARPLGASRSAPSRAAPRACRRDAALFSGCAYAFSGNDAVLRQRVRELRRVRVVASVVRGRRARRSRARPGCAPRVTPAAAAGLAFGLQLLAGEPAISLLTAGFTALLCLGAGSLARPRASGRRARARSFSAARSPPRSARRSRRRSSCPFRAVLPLTYRGQHLYSRAAFGSAPFLPYRIARVVLSPLRGRSLDTGKRRELASNVPPAGSRLRLVRDLRGHRALRGRSSAACGGSSGRAAPSRSPPRGSRPGSSASGSRSPSHACSSRPTFCAGSATRSSSTS